MEFRSRQFINWVISLLISIGSSIDFLWPKPMPLSLVSKNTLWITVDEVFDYFVGDHSGPDFPADYSENESAEYNNSMHKWWQQYRHGHFGGSRGHQMCFRLESTQSIQCPFSCWWQILEILVSLHEMFSENTHWGCERKVNIYIFMLLSWFCWFGCMCQCKTFIKSNLVVSM